MQIVNLDSHKDSDREFAKFIDQTLLRPNTTQKEIIDLCEEANKEGFATVCITPPWVTFASCLLHHSVTKPITVIGFPSGCPVTKVKWTETEIAIQDGAQEIDMVMNVGWLKDKNYERVENEIQLLKKICGSLILKVIIETSLLSFDEKIIASRLVEAAGADFVKTSTGFNGGGATVADIELIRSVVSPSMQIKASGGIRNIQQAKSMIKAGASRIGTSSGGLLLRGLSQQGNY